ncbi:MAG: hypothetical protein FWF50_07465, partial [Defluviitaleaceae bacterium]|nr:hypothetical protein [Defluviitaleaceae bacterium]
MNEKMNHKQTALKRLISIVLSITIFVTSFLPFINIAVANSSFQRIPSEYYTASFMYHSQWYDNTQF